MKKPIKSHELINGRRCVVTKVDDKTIREEYLDNERDKPDSVGYYNDGSLLYEIFSDNPEIQWAHRLTGPTEIQYIILDKEFFWSGNFGLDDGGISRCKYIVDDSDFLLRLEIYRNRSYIWRSNYSTSVIDNKIKTYHVFGNLIPELDFYTPGFIDAFILENS